MKKIILSIAFLMAGIVILAQTYNVTVTGLVTNDNNGEPVVGQEIVIFTDSVSGGTPLTDTVFTNEAGIYTTTFTANSGEQGMVIAETFSCGVIYSGVSFYSQVYNNPVINLIVCDNNNGGDCQALFSYIQDGDKTIQYYDQSIGNIESWSWEFGDGNTSSEQNPSHTFSDYGTYLTTLTIVADSGMCTSTTELVVILMDSVGNNCQAMFDYQNLEQMGVQFTDLSFGNPDSWYWDFGDGSSSVLQNPTYYYNDNGLYLVSLTITNDSTQCTSTVIQSVIVGDTIYPPECQASFWYYNDSIDMLKINFLDMSTSVVGIASWTWNFGDGSTSNEQNPSHTYNEPGMYVVCLTVSDSSGTCEDIYCMDVIVGTTLEDCQAQFFYYPADTNNAGTGQQLIQFVDLSIGDPDTWSWDFGDGQSSNEQNPTHYYNDPGLYEVCLTISNTLDSCFSTYCEFVEVLDSLPGCYTWFTYEVAGLNVDFTAYIEGNQGDTEFFWEFGDGNTASGQTTEHTYAQEGTYIVTLTASSSGCITTYQELIFVGALNLSIGGNVYLDDSTLMADNAVVYLITFDTVNGNLVAIETTDTDEFGFYLFEDVNMYPFIYFVQAELTEASGHYGQYVPTYHYNSINWEYATPVIPFLANYYFDIALQPVTSSSTGSAQINGSLTGESTRGAMVDVEIMLLNQDDSPISYIRTNESGQFDFSTLNFGTYKVKTEMVGVISEPIIVTLSEEVPSVSLEIVIHDGHAVLGVNDPVSEFVNDISDVYPNPVTSEFSIDIEMKKAAPVVINIKDQYGKLIMSQQRTLSNGINKERLTAASLSNGIYFINIYSEDGLSQFRRFVKLR